MPLDQKKLRKPLVQLRKLLRKTSRVPTQDEVHHIRTNTRRTEATVEALQLDRRRKGRRTLRAITPIRKRAGEVRDMDVLMGFSATISSDSDGSCLVRLLEHLGKERARGARKLRKTILKRRKVAIARLRACASLIEKNFEMNNARVRTEWPVDAAAVALRISRELMNWPKLSADSLHAFRLKVKELRYVVQLSGQDNELIVRLGAVKDLIGEWHDWAELDAMAKELLSECHHCGVVSQIAKTARNKFETALKASELLRKNYFEGQVGRKRRIRRGLSMKSSILKATASLAA